MNVFRLIRVYNWIENAVKCLIYTSHSDPHLHFLRTPPPLPTKEYTSHFLSAKNPHENNKNQAKKLIVYEKNYDFHRPPSTRKCMICTLVKMLILIIMDGPLEF